MGLAKEIEATPGTSAAATYKVSTDIPMRDFLREAEAAYIAAMLEYTGGNQSAAARAAGEKVDTFHKKMKRLGISVQVKKCVTVVRDGQ